MGLYKDDLPPKKSIKEKILEILKPFKAKKRDKLSLIRPGVKKLTEPNPDKIELTYNLGTSGVYETGISKNQTCMFPETKIPYVSGSCMQWDHYEKQSPKDYDRKED